jgi:hypothetical protein
MWQKQYETHTSIRPDKAFFTYAEAQKEVDANNAELERIANLSDYDWSVEQIDKTLNIWQKLCGATDEEKQKSDESVRKMLEEKQEPKSGIYIDNISYVGGHDSISTETIQSNGILSIKGDLLIYYSNYKKLFSIPISKIKSVTYDKSENITLTRIATLGLGALVFKKKTYYLLIEYIAKNELVNSLVFSPKIKDDRFLNELNVARNKYAYITKGNDLNEKIESKSTVEKLSLLKDLLSKDLISDEEYQKKKDEILNKL